MPPYRRGIPKAGTGFEGSPDGKMASTCCLHPNGGLKQMAEERDKLCCSVLVPALCRSRDGPTLACSSQLEKWFTINHIPHGFGCQGGQSMLRAHWHRGKPASVTAHTMALISVQEKALRRLKWAVVSFKHKPT